MDGRPDTLAEFTQWTEERYGPTPALRFRTGPGEGNPGGGPGATPNSPRRSGRWAGACSASA